MEYGASEFSTSPKLDGFDMVILNLDENNYISSPSARIAEITEASDMVDTAKSYPYIGSERGYTAKKWYSYVDDQDEEGNATQVWKPTSNYTPWVDRRVGKYIFAWNATQGYWRLTPPTGSGSNVTPEQLYSTYGIDARFAISGDLTDAPKAGDTITVVLLKTSDSDVNDKQNVSISCRLTRSGSCLEANCPLVKPAERQSVADQLLASVYGHEYQPYKAGTAVIDPAAELGDAIHAYGAYSGIYQQDLYFDSLMPSDVSAPIEEEVDNELGYQSELERNYNRKFADIAAEFLIKADEISARVTKEGSGDGFSWSLVYDGFTISSGNRPVFKVNKEGAQVIGKITAESGYIGTANKGFAITASSIYNSVVAADPEQDLKLDNINDDKSKTGIYIGTDGIYLGGGKFKVTRSGEMTAKSADLTGKITSKEGEIGGFTIKEKYLYNGRDSLTSTDPGVFLGINGISVGKDDTHAFTAKADGTIEVKHGMTGIDDTTNASGLYIGTRGIALGGGKFKVTSGGKVSASDLDITGGSITIGRNNSGQEMFKVTSGGVVTARSLSLIGGSISIGSGQNGENTFTVSNSGAVTASNLKITGGSISIGTNFSVDSQGNLRANSGSFGGTVHAGKIISDGENDTMGGGKITARSIEAGRTVQAVQDRLGWANDYNNATKQNTSNYPAYFRAGNMRADILNLNTSMTAPTIEATTSFTGKSYKVQSAGSTYGGAGQMDLVSHYHSFSESGGRIYIGAPTASQGSFNIADTKTYKDMVSALTITSFSTNNAYSPYSGGYYNYYAYISISAKNASGVAKYTNTETINVTSVVNWARQGYTQGTFTPTTVWLGYWVNYDEANNWVTWGDRGNGTYYTKS